MLPLTWCYASLCFSHSLDCKRKRGRRCKRKMLYSSPPLLHLFSSTLSMQGLERERRIRGGKWASRDGHSHQAALWGDNFSWPHGWASSLVTGRIRLLWFEKSQAIQSINPETGLILHCSVLWRLKWGGKKLQWQIFQADLKILFTKKWLEWKWSGLL